MQVPLDADPLTLALIERLARAGYGIQRVDADQGARHLTLAASDTTLEDGASGRRLELRVGPTRLARSYAVDGDDVRPASALSVAGTRAPLALDDRPLRRGRRDASRPRRPHRGGGRPGSVHR